MRRNNAFCIFISTVSLTATLLKGDQQLRKHECLKLVQHSITFSKKSNSYLFSMCGMVRLFISFNKLYNEVGICEVMQYGVEQGLCVYTFLCTTTDPPNPVGASLIGGPGPCFVNFAILSTFVFSGFA